MATRKPPAKKRGATSTPRRRAAPPPRRGLPGWLWGLAGLVAGFLLAQHQHGTAPWQDGDSPLATVLPHPEGRQAPREEASAETPDEPPMPTFEFYTLLPESEVIAPGGKVPSSTATPPPRPEPEQAEPAASASGDDPIARVIAANMEADETARQPASSASDADARFVLQAASFREASDADRLAGRLKDFGLLAKISEVKTGGGDTWHRVQVGPYSDRRELNRAQDLMNTQGIEPLLIQLQN